ncbi:MAG: hypothetical protein HQ592_05750, partial [Planctomycetes bacterium]|nr:hypothetical protein [Planctomycetota bacterium]
MSIKLTCKMCTKELEVPNSFAGKRGKCPYCMEVLDIPAAGAPSAAEPEPEPKLKQLDAEEAVAPDESPAVAQRPAEQPPVAAPGHDRRTSEGRKLRLSILMPSAFVVVGAVVAILLFGNVFDVPPQHVQPKIEDAGVKATTVDAKTETIVPKDEPKEKPPLSDLDRFHETQKVAAGLPDNISTYIEIEQPEKFFAGLAGLPIWKDKSGTEKECKAAYEEVISALADQFGLDDAVMAGVLGRAHTLHLGFSGLPVRRAATANGKPGESECPILVVDLGEDASRDALFGKESSLQLANTLVFDEGKITVEQFQGKANKPMFAGYYDYYAVLATEADRVHQTLERLHAEEGGGLLQTAAFAQALAARDKDTTWIYLAPGNELTFPANNALARLLQLDPAKFVQASIDVPGNKITGTISPGGAIARLLGGPVSGTTAAYAPKGTTLYANVMAERLDALWAFLPYVPLAETKAALPVLTALGPALKPEVALIVDGDITVGGGAVVIPVSDAQRLQELFSAHFKPDDVAQHKGFKMASVADGVFLACGKEAVILAGGKATVRRCIDAAVSGQNLSKSKALEDASKSASAILMAGTHAVARCANPSTGTSLDTKATTLLSFGKRDDGAITISGDVGGLGVLAARVSDAAVKKELEQKRARMAEAAKAREKCHENIKSIHDAISRFVVRDLESMQIPLLEYPRNMHELIDAELLAPEVLRCPSDDSPKAIGKGIASSYELLFDGVKSRLSVEFSAEAVLVWERKPGHFGRHTAVFVSGRVHDLTPEQLQEAINKAEEEAQK